MKDKCSNGISEIESIIDEVKGSTHISCKYIQTYIKYTMCEINIYGNNGVYLDDTRIYRYI